ncbi:MAG: hypothetical protein M0C28_13160 [Candidatus Moduliflexus flocculans]|nr:hypothetical protein [Candidatus Moduliflexus flocculans]
MAQARDADPNLRLEARGGARRAEGSTRRLDLVLDAVTDPWPAMRAAGLRALKDIDLDTFVIVLSGLDADPHPSVRAAVVSLLPALGPQRAAPRLAAAMRRPGCRGARRPPSRRWRAYPRSRRTSPPRCSGCSPAATSW